MPSHGCDQLSTHGAVNGADKIGKHVRRLTTAGDPLNVKGLEEWTDWTWHVERPSKGNKKAVLPQGNRAMPQVFFSVEVRQQHSLQA